MHTVSYMCVPVNTFRAAHWLNAFPVAAKDKLHSKNKAESGSAATQTLGESNKEQQTHGVSNLCLLRKHWFGVSGGNCLHCASTNAEERVCEDGTVVSAYGGRGGGGGGY